MPSTFTIDEFVKKKNAGTGSSTTPTMNAPQPTAPATGGMSIDSFVSKKNQTPTAPAPYDVPEKQDGFLETLVKDPLETLLVKPADRTAEALGRLGLFGNTIKKGYEAMADEGKGRSFFGIDVEPQRGFKDGGAKQIAGEALKTASYLYTGGKAAPAANSVISGTARPTLNAMFQGAKVGAVGGGAYGAGNEMTKKDSTVGSIAKEGAVGTLFGGGVGAAGGAVAPQLTKLISPAERLIRREQEIGDALKRVAVSRSSKSNLARDAETVNRALREVDLDGVTTNAELVTRLDEQIGTIAKKMDEVLETDPTRRKMDQLTNTIDVNGQKVTHNYVSEALDQLEKEYIKTNNLRKLAEVRQIRQKAISEGLTTKEVNDIARRHASDLNAFSPLSGELSSGLAKQTAENTRKGLKTTARTNFGNEISQEADKAIADLSRLKTIAQGRAQAVERAKTMIVKPSMSQRVGGLLEQALNIATLGTSRGLFHALANSTLKGAAKTQNKLNAIELEKMMAKDIKLIQEASQQGASEETIIRKLEEFIRNNGEKPVLMLEAPKPSTLFATPGGKVTPVAQEASDVAAVEAGRATTPPTSAMYQKKVREIQDRLEPYLTPEEMQIIQMGRKPKSDLGLPTANSTPNVYVNPRTLKEIEMKLERYLTPDEMEIIDWGPGPKKKPSSLNDIYID